MVDEEFDIGNHFSFAKIGGSEEELRKEVAAYIAQVWDFSKPLWGFRLVHWGGKTVVVWRLVEWQVSLKWTNGESDLL